MIVRWTNAAGEQGTLSVDVEGRIEVDVDDGFYSGVLSRTESLALALAVLECETVPVPENQPPDDERDSV